MAQKHEESPQRKNGYRAKQNRAVIYAAITMSTCREKKVIDFALFKYSALLLIIVLCGYQQFFFTLCATKKKKFLYTLYDKEKKTPDEKFTHNYVSIK